jgi:chromate transport protein ChrA
MAIFDFSNTQNIIAWILVGIIIVIVLIAFSLTDKTYKNYNLSLILMLGFIIGLFIAPIGFNFLFLIGFLILLFNIIFHTVFPKFFILEEDKLLVDKIPQVWDQFKFPPEAKTRSEAKK